MPTAPAYPLPLLALLAADGLALVAAFRLAWRDAAAADRADADLTTPTTPPRD